MNPSLSSSRTDGPWNAPTAYPGQPEMALDPAARGRSNRDAASSAEPLLRLEGICKRFGVLKANDEISLTLRAGEIHAIIGENGAGKTTLMNILYGIYQADSGTVLRHGEPLRLRSPSEAIKAGISLVSQHFLLIERHTVAENLALGLPQSGWWFARQRIARDVEILARDYGLDLDLNARVSDLAPGLRQRLEIVKALLRRSRILILDEPTSVLTPQEATRLFQVLRRLREQGCAIVFISHKLDEVLALSDRISVLRKGRLELTVDRAQASAAALSRAMIGSELAPPAPRAAAAESSVRLRVDGLRLGPRAGPVSFSVHRGEIFGIAGVAGNGQVELAQALTGLRPAGGARIALDGDDLEGLDPIGFREKGVAHIPEDRNHLGVVPSMTVEENVLLCWLHRPSFRRGPLLAWKDIGRVATDLIERYRIATPSRLTRTSLLSGGNVQKLILGRELLDRPRLIIAVHPTYGLDVQATAQVHRCFLEEAAEGAAVILISEDLEEIMSLSDRIGVLFNRTLMGIAPRAEARVERLGLWMAGDRS